VGGGFGKQEAASAGKQRERDSIKTRFMKERQAILIYILERLGGTRRRRETAPASESDFILFGGRRRALKPEISFLPRGHVVNIPFYIMFPRCLAIAARWKAFPFMRDFILSLSLARSLRLSRTCIRRRFQRKVFRFVRRVDVILRIANAKRTLSNVHLLSDRVH